MDFDPRFVNIQPLQKDTFYLYTRLPVPPCTNINLNYVNFCYNFSRSNVGPQTEIVARVYILKESFSQRYTLQAFRSFQADVSSCEGNLLRNGNYSLCCISKPLNYNWFTIDRECIDRTFAIYVPSHESSISFGYTDDQDYKVSGFQPSFIETSIGSRVTRSTEYSLPLPLVSFTATGISFKYCNIYMPL